MSSQATLFQYAPCVFIAGADYQIGIAVTAPCLAWIEIDGVAYHDHVNGVGRSECAVHKVTVPREALDQARGYAVCLQPMLDRKPYYPETGGVERQEFAFEPLTMEDGLRIYMISDTHSRTEEPVAAARFFGEAPHLLVLNGDIADKSSSIDNILTLYKLNDALTYGTKPILFVRGNHDTRGANAIDLMDYMGLENGRTYFTFRIGALWGIVLDCGEDKRDHNVEYGGTACFEPFRREETAFIERVAASGEWADEGIAYRIAICHIPFASWPERVDDQFRIEQSTYARWTALMNEMKVDMLLSGHWHSQAVLSPGGAGDTFGMNFPVVVGSTFLGRAGQPGPFSGAAVTLSDSGREVLFTDDQGAILARHDLSRGEDQA